jgi:hypothetical protein
MGGDGSGMAEIEAGLRCTCVVLISLSCLSKILAISIVIPQKSGTKCAQVAWHVKEQSVVVIVRAIF